LLEHIDILDTWEAMERIQARGYTKRIGVSNFSIEMLERMQFSPRVTVQPYVNQVEHSVYNQQLAMIHYLEPRGIKLTSWSPFVHGLHGPGGCPVFEDPVLVEIGKELGRTPGQVALRYLLGLSPIVNVIPKSVTRNRIQENIDVTFDMNDDQVARIRQMNRGFRFFDGVNEFGEDVLSLGLGY
jgi:diketogulonate reductase-like aldo/keto reductase